MRIRMSDLEAVLRRVPVLGVVVLLAGVLGGCAGGPLRPGLQSPPATPTPPASPPQTPTPPPKPTLPTEPTWTPPPTKGPITPTPVALCAFGPPAPPEPGPSLEAYVFSEPSVVLTHTSGIAIVGWLPDGQNLLITRFIIPSRRGTTESIRIFNVIEGTEKGYGEWGGFSVGFDPKPVWLSAISAVAFADRVANQQIGLYIAQGGALPRLVVTDLTSYFIAASPTGDRVVFFAESAKGQPEIYNASQEQVQALPYQLPFTQRVGAGVYQAVWHPDGNRIAFYSNAGFYLADMNTGQICEIDLGIEGGRKRWAVSAQWSPNGHYLATLTTVGEPIVPFIDLTLIDMGTGERHHLNLGHQYLGIITWSPNSRDLLVVAKPPAQVAGLDSLYIVNANTLGSRRMLSDYPFILTGGWGAAWSPSGREIALACPTIDPTGTTREGRLCIISIEVK